MLKTYNASELEVKEITLNDSCAVISIREEHGPDYQLNFTGNTLIVKFSDVTAKVNVNDVDFNPISKEDAAKMVDFIEENKNKNFVVNCSAGVSRSAAVCLFIHHTYGHSLKENFWLLSSPNPFVLGKLIIEYEENNSA